MKLETQITFTPWTIDTYQLFDMEGVEYQLLPDDGPQDVDAYEWTYNNKEYVQALADSWRELVNEHATDDIVRGVELVGEAYSPKYYNFTTDNCQVSFDVDIDKLEQYVDAHRKQYAREHLRSCDGFMWFGDENDTMLEWYLRTVCAKQYQPNRYYMDQCDNVPAWEYVSCELIK